MEERIVELNKKIVELENRVNNLEMINKKSRRNKIIASLITLIFILVIAAIYVFVISKVFNNYINLF